MRKLSHRRGLCVSLNAEGSRIGLPRFRGFAVNVGNAWAIKRLIGRRYDDPIKAMGEIKRVWTAPSARGLGVARRVLRALEAAAREAGLKTLRLSTNRALTEAQALYRKEAYREISRFSDNPYAHHWFEKRL